MVVDLLYTRCYLVYIKSNGIFSTQAQEYSYICAMAFTGFGKGTIEQHSYRSDLADAH